MSALAERAANMLGSAGRHAFARTDIRTTIDLLERADALWSRESANRLRSLPDLADALAEVGQWERAMQLLKDGLAIAEGLDDRGLREHLRLAYRGQSDENPWSDLAERDARDALETFDGLGDEWGLAIAWRILGDADWLRMKCNAASTAWEKAAEHSARAGRLADTARNRAWMLVAMLFGSRPAADCLARANEELRLVSDFQAAKAEVLWTISNAKAMLGDFDGAREALDASRTIMRELGRDAMASHFATQVAEENAWYEGDMEERNRALREGLEGFERATGEKNPLLAGTAALALAQAGKVEEAEPLAEIARESSVADQPHIRVVWQEALALCRAAQGAGVEAESLIEEAVATLRAGEYVVKLADALLIQAEVLRRIGKGDGALAAAREALALYESKGVVGLVAHTRGVIDDLQVR